MSPKEEVKEVKLETEKQKGIWAVIAAIEKQYGKGSIMSGTEHISDIEFIPTGCISLDQAMGGGFAKGRIAEVYGPESTGKTTLALHAAAECQKLGGKVAFIDVEHSLDLNYSQVLGVDSAELLISQPSSAEEALNIVNLLVSSGFVDLVIVDSVAALVPQAELAGEIGDSHMGLQARILGQSLRMITGAISRSNSTVIFINQLRMKIGISFGNPEVTAGGNALKFYASQRLDIRTTGKTKMGEEIIGQTTKIKIVKNKVSPPFKEAEFSLEHGKGINKYADLLGVAVNNNLVDKAASWYSYNGERIGQGESTAIQWLKDNPKIFDSLYGECSKK